MRTVRRAASAVFLGAPLLIAGCSLLPSTRKLPVPKAPATVQTVDPEELIAQLNQRWDALETLTAKVTIQASQIKPDQGVDSVRVFGNGTLE